MHDGSQLRKPVWLPAWERKAFIYSGWSLIIILPEGGEKWGGAGEKKKMVKLSFLSLTFVIRPNVSWHFVIVPSAVSFYFQLNI